MNLFFWRKEKQQPQAKYGASYRRVGDIMRVDEAFDDLGSPTGAPAKDPERAIREAMGAEVPQ